MTRKLALGLFALSALGMTLPSFGVEGTYQRVLNVKRGIPRRQVGSHLAARV
jgi:hypothetical protein